NKLCCKGGGGAGDFCTAAGTACRPSDDKCEPCGKKDAPCCDGNRCDDGGCCDGARQKCVAAGGACFDNSICVAGGCAGGPCGGIGRPSCAGTIGCPAPWAAPGPDGICAACGGADEPCCPGVNGRVCAPPYACSASDGTCN